jgi:hypothetical protein
MGDILRLEARFDRSKRPQYHVTVHVSHVSDPEMISAVPGAVGRPEADPQRQAKLMLCVGSDPVARTIARNDGCHCVATGG